MTLQLGGSFRLFGRLVELNQKKKWCRVAVFSNHFYDFEKNAVCSAEFPQGFFYQCALWFALQRDVVGI